MVSLPLGAGAGIRHNPGAVTLAESEWGLQSILKTHQGTHKKI